MNTHTHTHTHTLIYIYIYIYRGYVWVWLNTKDTSYQPNLPCIRSSFRMSCLTFRWNEFRKAPYVSQDSWEDLNWSTRFKRHNAVHTHTHTHIYIDIDMALWIDLVEWGSNYPLIQVNRRTKLLWQFVHRREDMYGRSHTFCIGLESKNGTETWLIFSERTFIGLWIQYLYFSKTSFSYKARDLSHFYNLCVSEVH